MFQSLDFFVLSCLFLTVQSRQGQILKPQNVSLQWISDFYAEVTWAPPQHSVENCTYYLIYETSKEYSTQTNPSVTSPWVLYIVMEGGYLHLTLETVCNDVHSERAVIIKNYPELVRNLQCYIHSPKQTRCSWLPDRRVPDLRFFYRLLNNDYSVSANDKPAPRNTQECSSYNYADGMRTGCDLEADINHEIRILLNGTLNNTLVRNTFKKYTKDDVRPPPLKWTVNKTGDKFYIGWTPPSIKDSWTFTIRYTECEITKNRTYTDGETSTVLDVISHCPYLMDIKAESKGGGTPWSEKIHFDADKNPRDWLYAAVITPLMFAGLAALGFVCCRKNKETIFPKIPGPSDLLSDIPGNNNKSSVCNLLVPIKEEEICKITLVSDSHNNNPDL